MTIPKIVFQTSKNKPEKYIINKILSKCNDWKYTHYDDNEAIQFFNENYIEEFKDIVTKFNEMPTGAHKADLFRYYYLYINGGVFIDSDAMIEMNIENVIQDYDFFSVSSCYISNLIFQGFIGSTPKNIIIYEALQDAYNINTQTLSNNFHLLCYNLYNIVKNNENNNKIKLYNEKFSSNKDGCSETLNDDNETILIHYFAYKNIPE